jgi:hypothetical protein
VNPLPLIAHIETLASTLPVALCAGIAFALAVTVAHVLVSDVLRAIATHWKD